MDSRDPQPSSPLPPPSAPAGPPPDHAEPQPRPRVDPRADRSRGAVYQAEDSVARVMAADRRAVRVGGRVVTLPAEIRFGTLEAMQRFVDDVLAHPPTLELFPGRGPVTVVPRRGFRAATYANGRIQIPVADPRGRWALTRAVVLHECAHHLAGAPGHGARFREALVHLYAEHVGAGAAALLGHLFAPIDQVPEPLSQDGTVRRVAALLAKAESTASPEESEAYLAKAALVAQRHSIDLAVAAWSAGRDADQPTHRMLTIGPPRASLNKHLVALLVSVARTWSVPVDVGHGSTYVLLYGVAVDLDQVESVFVTASTLMIGRAEEHVRSGTWRGTSYRGPDGAVRPVTAAVARTAFCLGFIQRLAQRLAVARSRAASASGSPSDAGTRTASATGGAGDDRVALALRARELAVTDYHRATTRARGSWRGSTSAAGSALGSRRAGERAAEEYDRRSLPGRRRALPGAHGIPQT